MDLKLFRKLLQNLLNTDVRTYDNDIRSLAALEEDLSSIQQFTTIVTPVPGDPMPSSGLCRYQKCMCRIDITEGKMPIHVRML